MMRNPALLKTGKRVLQIALPVIVLAAFLYEIQKWDWHTLLTQNYHWNPWLLALALLGFMLQELTFGLIWRNILIRLGHRLPIPASLRIYLASEFVRYIPGNVWHVLTRILWVNKYGVSKPVAFASMAIELITKLGAGALLFAASLLFWGSFSAVGSLVHGSLFIVLGVIGFVAMLVVLHPRILNGLLNFALHVLKREPVDLGLRYRDILLITLNWCGSWLFAGVAFYFITLAFWPNLPISALPICIGIYAIAWDIGFVSFITPSGLGFREVAIAGLFSLSLPYVTVGIVAIIAIVQRIVSTLAEVLCVGIAYFGGRKQMQAMRQEQLALPSTSSGSTSVTEIYPEHAVHTDAQISSEKKTIPVPLEEEV